MGEYIDDHIKACINPKMLEWARESAGYEEEEDAAKKLGIEKATLVSWERGESPLTLLQLRKMSRLYSLPTALFSLREIPSFDFPHKHITDCRYLSGDEVGRYSPELVLEIARGVDRRAFVLDLFEEAGEKDERPERFSLRAKKSNHFRKFAREIRESLDLDSILKKDKRKFFSILRGRIESLGVLVFGMSDVKKAEASGFSYWFDELPVISVNVNLDLTFRILSLLRGLTYLMLKRSVVFRIDEYGLSHGSYLYNYGGDKAERFCDNVVWEVLMPREIFRLRRHRRNWSVSEINSLSRTYKVNPSIIVNRLKFSGLLDVEFYEKELKKHRKELEERKKIVRPKSNSRPRISEVVPDASSKSGKGRRKKEEDEFSPDSVFDRYGHSFVRLVIESYNEDRMTLADASDYLGVSSGHISDVERQLWGH